jgi:glycosyltransferase involved in cell wall biosynthesis
VVSPVGNPDLSDAGPASGPILLNARAATRPTITGVERWAAEVIPRLRALDPQRYVVVGPRPRARRRLAAQTWEQVALPALARRTAAALVFSPANLAPLAWPRNVLVMHDAAVLREPDAYSRAYVLWHRWFGLAAARRALAVITVSEFSRGELVSLAGLDPGRVHVIPGGVGERFRPGIDHERVTSKLELHRPYVLTIATADRRKNLASLGVAARRLADQGIDLVWAGDDRPYFSSSGVIPGLRSLGYVDDADLPGLYAGARAFVLPSRYEGFGLTCLEAMACGVPVVASNRAALPETCGDAALLVDPDDPTAVGDALEQAVNDAAVRGRLRESGLVRAAALSWECAVRRVDEQLTAVTSESPMRIPSIGGSGRPLR